jgi:hypothetical protein
MAADPIISEIHKVREEYAKRFANDLYAICQDAYTKQGRSGRKVVKLAPRPVSVGSSPAPNLEINKHQTSTQH